MYGKKCNFAAPLSDMEGIGIARAPLSLGKHAVPKGENQTQGKRLPEFSGLKKVRRPENRREYPQY